MSLKHTLLLLPLASASLQAATYFQVFSEADASGGISGPFLDTVASDGTNVFSFSRAASGAVDESNISRFNGSGSFTTIVDTVAWNAARTGTFEVVGSNGAGITTGGELRFINFFDNSFYGVNTSTGIVSVIASSTDFDTFLGSSASLVGAYEVLVSGGAYALESGTDSILAVSPSGGISTAISSSDLLALAGGTSIGGIGVNGSVIYIGSNSNDALSAFDTATNIPSVVLTTGQIKAVTDDPGGAASFGDIFFAPDGLVYFYEGVSDHLLAFDPADPANTLKVVLSEDELNAGPGDDTLNQLTWYQGNIAWTNAGDGFFAVPEPSVSLLALLGLIPLARRRR